MNRPIYTKRPIAKARSLARALSLSPRDLEQLSAQAESYYYPHESIPKDDGTRREIFGVTGELKTVQVRIRKHFLDNVRFPRYLQGSIRDKDSPRSYIADAKLHAESKVIIGVDIRCFFPSTSATVIQRIWKHFFSFPSEIAATLTELTTYRGFLPTGASTSPGLANLVFFDEEPKLVDELQQQQFVYSRYVDDVSISTAKWVALPELEHVFTRVFGMFARRGLRPNRRKIDIATRGSPLQVHRLNVNAGRPTLPKSERSRIRAAVKRCEGEAKLGQATAAYEELWLSVHGRVQMLRIMHPTEGTKYLNRLKAIQPT